jgi:ribose 5-phosphate isomerase A
LLIPFWIIRCLEEALEPPNLEVNEATPTYDYRNHAQYAGVEEMSEAPNAAQALAALKRQAAEYAVSHYVESGMTVGLGTGSTAIFAVRYLGELLRTGQRKDIVAFATSRLTWDEAVRLSIPMLPEDLPKSLDLTIDGADEVDPQLNLIKGGGGALLREKIVAQSSGQEIIVVDETKLSPCLGTRRAVPVEILPFGWRSQAAFITGLGATCVVRHTPDGNLYFTDQRNMILDCAFGRIANPAEIADQLDRRAGIVEHGLFLGLTDLVVASGASGIRVIPKPNLS